MDKIIGGIASINDKINEIVWGAPMIVLILSTGIYFTIKTKAFQITRFVHIFKKTILSIFTNKKTKISSDKKSISQFQALSTALAATMGTGNIVGVATAITVGGAGAIFWMWVSAVLGMMTIYAENILGIFYRYKNSKNEWVGGPMVYIEKGLKCKWLGIIFAILCVFASFGIGNMAQINSISSSMESLYKIPPIVTGIIVALTVGGIIIGGIKRIGKVTEKVIPFISIVYILGAIIIIALNYRSIPSVFESILKNAFGFSSVAGGISGVIIKNAITMGLKRGIFSNEAGMGSSVLVHVASDVKEPCVQGMWGIAEVFIDTIVCCTLTAVVILSTGVVGAPGANGEMLDGAPLVIEAFSHGFGNLAGHFVCISIIIFAFATLLGWSYIGEKSMEYLFGEKSSLYYKLIFIIFILFGATVNISLAWNISDTLNGFMVIPNLTALILLSGTVIKVSNNYVKRKLSKEKKKIVPLVSAYRDIQERTSKEIMNEIE